MIDRLYSGKVAQSFVVAAVTLSTLAGCAGLEEPRARAKEVQEKAMKLRDENVASATSAGVHRTSRPRISGQEVVLRSLNTLPAKFSTPVSYSTHGAQGFAEVLEAVSERSGISIRGTEVLQPQGQGALSGASGPAAQQMTGGVSSGKLGGSVQIEYSGTLRGLLDELAARTESSWRYTAATNSVNFFRFETRTLSVHLPPGAKNVAASISLSGIGGGSSGGSSGGSGGGDSGGGSSAGNVSVSQSQVIDPWSSVMRGIQSILGSSTNSRTGSTGATLPAGGGGLGAGAGGGGGSQQSSAMSASGDDGQASANPELGMITVTARPQAVERIAAYINSINARFAQNVMIDFKVLNLTLDNNMSAGFSLDLLYKQLNNNGLSVVGGAPLQAGTTTPGRMVFTNGNPNSQWRGSEIVAEALMQFGTVAVKTEGQVTAINGQPAPFQMAEEVTYLASSQTTTAPTVGSTTALTPGSRIVGFTANMTPLVLGDNRILLQYQMEISRITLAQASSGNATIQTPRVSKQSLQNQAFMRDGEVIVLFAFDQNRDSADSALSLGGASRTGRGERSLVVIVMQVSGGRKNG